MKDVPAPWFSRLDRKAILGFEIASFLAIGWFFSRPSYTLSHILGTFAITAFLIYILWRSGDPLRHFGLRWKPWRNFVECFAINLIVLGLVTLPYHYFVLKLQPKWQYPTPAVYLVIPQILLNGFLLTLVFVGYLLPRLRELGASKPIAGLIAALICGAIAFTAQPESATYSAASVIPPALCFYRWRNLYAISLGNAIVNFVVWRVTTP